MEIHIIFCGVLSVVLHAYAVKEGAPGPPTVLKTETHGPTAATLIILPFEDQNEILAYDVDYSDLSGSHHKEFKPKDAITLENLYPTTTYNFKISARNHYGSGSVTWYQYTTGGVDVPSPIQVISDQNERYAHEYILVWKEPYDGGLDVRSYRIQFRPVKLVDGQVIDVLDDWTAFHIDGATVWKTHSYTLKDLSEGTSYEVIVTAFNDMGGSSPVPFTFTTAA